MRRPVPVMSLQTRKSAIGRAKKMHWGRFDGPRATAGAKCLSTQFCAVDAIGMHYYGFMHRSIRGRERSTMAESAEHRSGSRDQRNAISQAYLSTGKSLRRFILRICANPADAEDIAQEALVRAMSAESDRPIENPKAYLYRVAHNLAVRKRRTRSQDIMSYLEDIEEEEIASASPSIEDDVIVRERLGHLCDAIDTLPPACRQVFVMRKVYGHSHKEIAKKLGGEASGDGVHPLCRIHAQA